MSRDGPMPAIFVSHGAPTLALDDGPAHRFLATWGEMLGRPTAIVVLSAHFDKREATVTASASSETLYDFHGFADELYRLEYPAPGQPALAGRIVSLLEAGGIPVTCDAARGLDHGAWVPLMLMYPDADVPVVQVSIDSSRGAGYHHSLGALLAPLATDGALIMGSGSATHNLELVLSPDRPAEPPDWTVRFAEWLADAVAAGETGQLIDYRTRAPFAAQNHPTEEHYFPLLAALGAAGSTPSGERVHASYTYGALSMDCYEFRAGPEAHAR